MSPTAMAQIGSRARAGLRFDALVQTWGRALYGTAKLPGETVIGEDRHFRLVHIPGMPGAKPQPALFHVGGVLPYGDAFFRLLPEICFYERFTERGMPVYAMELKGDREHTGLPRLDAGGSDRRHLRAFSGMAFDHARRKEDDPRRLLRARLARAWPLR